MKKTILNLLAMSIISMFGILTISAQTITVWEKTTQLYQHNFPVNSSKLTQIRSLPYSTSNRDFAGWESGRERYDLYFSTPNGRRVTKSRRCLTIRGQSTKGGFNITRVDIKTGNLIRYYSKVTNYRIGNGGVATSRFKVVDGDKDGTWSKFGTALGRKYMSITVCNPKRLFPITKPISVTPRFPKIPKGCPKSAKRFRITRNATTGTKRTKSMTSFLNNVKQNNPGQSIRDYGVGGQNKFFGDSLPLKSCKICAGKLTAVVDNQKGLAHNDGFYVFLSDNTFQNINSGSIGNKLIALGSYGTNTIQSGRIYLWESATESSPKTLKLNLNNDGALSAGASPQTGISRINQYLFSNSNPHLEVWAQDDTIVKSLVLDVWTY